METNLILYGAGGHCKVIIDILLSNNQNCQLSVIDDNPQQDLILGVNIYKVVDYVISSNQKMILCIGNNIIRKKIANQFLNLSFPKAIHQLGIISPNNVIIGNGTVVMAGSVINPNSTIGKHCIINTGAIVEHDCQIEDYVHICPNVAIAGEVSIGEGTQVGIGSTIIQQLKVGKWATIGAGSVIIEDVPDYAVVVGNPGRIIKYNRYE